MHYNTTACARAITYTHTYTHTHAQTHTQTNVLYFWLFWVKYLFSQGLSRPPILLFLFSSHLFIFQWSLTPFFLSFCIIPLSCITLPFISDKRYFPDNVLETNWKALSAFKPFNLIPSGRFTTLITTSRYLPLFRRTLSKKITNV